MAVKIKLRAKPKKPERKMIEERTYIDYATTLQDFVDIYEGFDLSKVYLEEDVGYYGEDDRYYFVGKRPETDEEFNKRTEQYERAIKKYNEWYEENEQEIIEEKQLRKQKEAEKRKKELEKERIRLEKSAAKINKLMKDLDNVK